MAKGLAAVALVAILAVLGVYMVGHYQTLDACTEIDHRLDEAARAPAPGASVTPETAAEAVRRLAVEVRVDVEDVSASLEPLTAENAKTLSHQAAQAVGIAAKLPNYQIQGQILQLEATVHAKRMLAHKTCQLERRILVGAH